MFSFFRKKTKPEAAPAQQTEVAPEEQAEVAPVEQASESQAPASAPVQPPSVPEPVAASPIEIPEPAAQPELQPVAAPQHQPEPAAEQVEQSPAPVAIEQVEHSPAPAAIEQAEHSPAPAAIEQAEPSPAPADIEPAAPAPAPARQSWLSRLKQGLARTGQNLGGLFVGVKVDEDLFEELETALIMADAGMEATEKLLAALRARVKKDRLTDAQAVKAALREILAEHLKPLEKSFPLGSSTPLVVMIAGVNGAGKTTSIGKLAHTFQGQGASVLLAAADTFRAAAREQLMEWGARNNVTVVAQEGGDPAAVAFDAVNAGRARQAGVVMVDTAGRLPTQLHLMEELKKIKRVIGKADGAAPHEVLLVVDGNTGQNAISQIKAFDAAIGLTGLVVTKLDGTAKGGTLAALAAGSQGVRPVPVYWIGVGEGMHDLQTFVASEFAAALLGD